MTNLGGHCLETLTDAFDRAADDVPTMFIAYTIKGFGLPFAGHKDNHAGLMNPTQIAALRDQFGIAEGGEWEPYGGLGDNAAASLQDRKSDVQGKSVPVRVDLGGRRIL